MDTSYLQQQVSTIIGKLHELFDEIGVASHERDTRESELFSALSETLHNQLRIVANEKHEMAEEAARLITTIQQMEISLEGPRDNPYQSSSDLEVTYPLTQCLQSLNEKHATIAKLHRERFEQVRKLVDALESYSAHLEPSFVKLALPPTSPTATISASFDISATYVSALDAEFTHVYEEYNRRREHVKVLADEIIMLWAELGTPQAQTDEAIVEYGRDAPEQLGLHQDDIARLKARREKLIEEKKGREKRVKELRTVVEELWDRLGVEDGDRKAFLNANRGYGLRTINEFEDELARLNELKRQNLHLFVEDARFKLQELWDSLYFSEEEMLDFTPAFSDVFSDALLSAHEHEIARLEALKAQRAPTLAMVERHRALIRERNDLAASSQDASRLMARGQKGERRDPGKLLREEKMRKRIAKELPKVEAELRTVLERWEDEYGRPFLIHGERFLDELAAASAKPAPPRSKTPNALNPPARPGTAMGKSVPLKSAGGSVRAPPRSKTPSAQPFSKSISATTTSSAPTVAAQRPMPTARTSPSKIPSPSKTTSRVPLSHMPHGNNSPERRANPAAHTTGTVTGRETVRNMGPPPARAPPPKMKNLFVPPITAESAPTPAHGHDRHAEHAAYLERSASIVRTIAPEDPYADDPRFANRPASRVESTYSNSTASSGPGRPNMSAQGGAYGLASGKQYYGVGLQETAAGGGLGHHTVASSRETASSLNTDAYRVMSGASSVLSDAGSGYTNPTTVGSENWEAYESMSEVGMDGEREYQQQQQQQQQQLQQRYMCQMKGGVAPSGGAGAGVKRAVIPGQMSPRLGKRAKGEGEMEVERKWRDEDVGYA